jgi:hypothetical protein
MKKIVLSFLFGVLSTAAFAGNEHPNPSNGFSDLYVVVNGRVLGAHVLSGQIAYQKLTDTQFLLTEPSGILSGGVAQVAVGLDPNHACLLNIQDIDFNIPVLASQQCIGGVSVASFNGDYNNTTITLRLSNP